MVPLISAMNRDAVASNPDENASRTANPQPIRKLDDAGENTLDVPESLSCGDGVMRAAVIVDGETSTQGAGAPENNLVGNSTSPTPAVEWGGTCKEQDKSQQQQETTNNADLARLYPPSRGRGKDCAPRTSAGERVMGMTTVGHIPEEEQKAVENNAVGDTAAAADAEPWCLSRASSTTGLLEEPSQSHPKRTEERVKYVLRIILQQRQAIICFKIRPRMPADREATFILTFVFFCNADRDLPARRKQAMSFLLPYRLLSCKIL